MCLEIAFFTISLHGNFCNFFCKLCSVGNFFILYRCNDLFLFSCYFLKHKLKHGSFFIEWQKSMAIFSCNRPLFISNHRKNWASFTSCNLIWALFFVFLFTGKRPVGPDGGAFVLGRSPPERVVRSMPLPSRTKPSGSFFYINLIKLCFL